MRGHLLPFVTGSQVAVQTQFDAQARSPHSGFYLRASDWLTPSGQREGIVIADHPLFDMVQRSSQIDLRRQWTVQIHHASQRPGEALTLVANSILPPPV